MHKKVQDYEFHPFRDVWRQMLEKAMESSFGGQHLKHWTDAGMFLQWPVRYPDCTSNKAALPSWKSTIPSPTLFTGVVGTNREKIQRQFFILRCIIRTWWGLVIDRDVLSDETYSLTNQQWRDILHGSYWKAQWPQKGSRYDPNVDPSFDVLCFWKYGDPKMLRDQPHPEELQLRPRLKDGTFLTPEHFESDQLKQYVLWDLRVTQMRFILQALDEALRTDLSGDELQNHISTRDSLFRNTPNLFLFTPKWESDNDSEKRAWFTRFRNVIMRWRIPPEAAFLLSLKPQITFHEDIDSMSGDVFDRYQNKLIHLFYQSVVSQLRVLPPILTSRPPFSGLDLFWKI
jgi:hypothetical protein